MFFQFAEGKDTKARHEAELTGIAEKTSSLSFTDDQNNDI